MDKFTECLKNKEYAMASKELEESANCFGFAKKVPDMVQDIENAEAGEEAYTFCVAFIIAMSKRYPDGRCEGSVGFARRLLESGLELNDDTANAYREVERRVVGCSMHPTVMQQAAQFVFYFLDTVGAVPGELKENRSWWRMPLI